MYLFFVYLFSSKRIYAMQFVLTYMMFIVNIFIKIFDVFYCRFEKFLYIFIPHAICLRDASKYIQKKFLKLTKQDESVNFQTK